MFTRTMYTALYVKDLSLINLKSIQMFVIQVSREVCACSYIIQLRVPTIVGHGGPVSVWKCVPAGVFFATSQYSKFHK